MKNKTLHLILYLTIFLTSLIAYVILLKDFPFHLSIASIIIKAHSLDVSEHLLVLGILPIYISLVIFGTALLGFYVGKVITSYLSRFW